MEYGLTKQGLLVKTLQQILKEEREAFITAFGSDIDMSDDSVAGAYIGNQAAKQTQLWEIIEGLWWACDIDSASGVYLDRLASMVSVLRNSATATQVYEALWGDNGTVIPRGHLLSLPQSGELFQLKDSVTITKENLLGFSFKITEIIPSVMYSFIINGVTISYLSGLNDSKYTIQQSLMARIEYVLPNMFTGINHGDDGLEMYRIDGRSLFSLVFTDAKMEIIHLAARGIYSAQISGPMYVQAGKLTEIVSSVSGLDHAVNYIEGVTGRNVESDAELRLNLHSRQINGSSNEIAIANAVEKVKDVSYVKLYSNRSRETVEERPPNSFEVVVVGGDDTEICKTIFDTAPAGIQPFGNTSVIIYDEKDNPWDIRFSRPNNRYIWIKLGVVRYSEESFPVDGVEQIKSNIIRWSNENLLIGTDVLYQRFNMPIYQVAGVATADIKIAVTDDLTPPSQSAYSNANIAISNLEIALVDISRIEVSLE